MQLFLKILSMHYIYVTMITIRKVVDNIGKIKIADTSLSIIFRNFAKLYKNEAKVVKPRYKKKGNEREKIYLCVYFVYVFIASELYRHVRQTPIPLHKYTFVRRLLNW